MTLTRHSAGVVISLQSVCWLRRGGGVASNLACIGLAAGDQTGLAQLIAAAHRSAREVGVFDDVHIGRWQDGSGAVLIFGWRPGELLDLTWAS